MLDDHPGGPATSAENLLRTSSPGTRVESLQLGRLASQPAAFLFSRFTATHLAPGTESVPSQYLTR